MALINVPDIQNLDAATPELWNSRFGTIANEINGNLDSANLKDGAVTAGKLASLSVTTGKLADAAITPDKWYNTYKFSAYRNAAWTAVAGTPTKVSFDTEDFDTSNNFDTTNARFTAPVTGFYQVSWAVSVTTVPASGAYQSALYKNGAVFKQGGQAVMGGASTATSPGSALVSLVAGDYLEVFQSSAGGTAGAAGAAFTYFTGFIVSIT